MKELQILLLPLSLFAIAQVSFWLKDVHNRKIADFFWRSYLFSLMAGMLFLSASFFYLGTH